VNTGWVLVLGVLVFWLGVVLGVILARGNQ